MRLIPLLCCPFILVAADVAAEKPTDVAVRVLPEMVSVSYSQYFDESGKTRNASAEMRVELALKPQGGRQLLSCRGVQVTTAITDTGEVLKPRARGSELGVESFNQHERDNDSYDVSLQFSAPGKLPQAIARLAGSMTLAVVSGSPTQSDIKPLKDFLGKPLLLEGMEQPVTVTRENGRITVRATRDAFERIDRVVGLRADGREIAFNGWGGGSDGDEYYRNYTADVPDDGGVQIRLMPAATEIVVPFSVGPMPLFPAQAAAATEAVRIPASKPKPEAAGAGAGAKPRVAPAPPAGGNAF